MYRKWNALCVCVVLLFCLSVVSIHGAELTGRDIMVKVDERPDGDEQRSVMKMTLINRRGKTRERSLLMYTKDYGKDSKSLMYFQSPGDVKGTGFLAWDYDYPKKDDDQWLYLPALKKSRRISSSSRNDYFMGTDFTYDDMGDRNVDEDIHELQANVQAIAQKLEDCSKEDLDLPKNVEKVRDLVFELEIAQGYLAEVFKTWQARNGVKAQDPAH